MAPRTFQEVPLLSHVLPSLPYAYDALEPYIDARTMEIHHTKHHQGYVNNLNAALKDHPERKSSVLSSCSAISRKSPKISAVRCETMAAAMPTTLSSGLF